MEHVKIEFLGIAATGGGRQSLELALNEPTPVREVLNRASNRLGKAVSPAQLEGRYMVLVEGCNIVYLEQWDTLVQPGQRVSVVPLLGGG
ncbi:MAG: hypothetical protein Kow0063_24370 [Anaerolineae bacterium]